jgi:hypothetical protein
MLRRVTGILAVIIGITVFCYSTWAAHRIGPEALEEPEWPRPMPYPDRWLSALLDYYEAKYPVTGPYVKLHGEFPRVMRDVTLARRAGAVICVAGILMLLLPNALRRLRSPKRGFDIIVGPRDRPID